MSGPTPHGDRLKVKQLDCRNRDLVLFHARGSRLAHPRRSLVPLLASHRRGGYQDGDQSGLHAGNRAGHGIPPLLQKAV